MRTNSFVIKIRPVATLSFFLAALFVRPSGMDDLLPALNSPINYLKILALIIIAFIMVIQKPEMNSAITLLLIYYMTLYGVSFFIKHSDLMLSEACSSLALALYSYMMYAKNSEPLIKGYAEYFLAIIVIQTIMIIGGWGLDGRAATGLFSNGNHMIRFFLAGMCFVFLDSTKRKGRLFTLPSILYFVCFSFIILSGDSATGIISYLAFVILLAIFYKRTIPKWLDLFHFAIYTMIVFAMIYFFHIQYYFSFFLVKILHKDMTLTKRVYVWDRALMYIRANPWFGIGSYSTYSYFLNGNAHAHQYWLQILLSGGIICFVIILAIYYIASKNLWKSGTDVGSRIIAVTIMAYLVGGIGEALTHSEMLLPLLVLASINGYNTEGMKKNRIRSLLHKE